MIAAVPRSLPALGLIAALAIAVAGCGSGSSAPSTSATNGAAAGPTAAGPAQESSTPSSTPTTATAPSGTATAGSAAGGSANGGGATNANGAPLGSSTAKSGDNSVQTYGSAAQGKDKAAVIAAMRSFMRAMATYDYPKLCAAFASQVRAGLAQFAKAGHKQAKGCASLLPKLLPRSGAQAQAARKAQAAKITAVRIGGGNAFVIFRPAGGPPSFFVMKLQGGAWKATGAGTGTPLVPSSG